MVILLQTEKIRICCKHCITSSPTEAVQIFLVNCLVYPGMSVCGGKVECGSCGPERIESILSRLGRPALHCPQGTVTYDVRLPN